jgi:hypothetical protein
VAAAAAAAAQIAAVTALVAAPTVAAALAAAAADLCINSLQDANVFSCTHEDPEPGTVIAHT